MRIAWPFYIVCDCSSSMWRPRVGESYADTPHSAMVDSILGLVDMAYDDVGVAQIAHVSIMTFADNCQVALPLTPVEQCESLIPNRLQKGTFTDVASMFRTARMRLQQDWVALQRDGYRAKRPTFFVITDGRPEVRDGSSRHGRLQPESEWLPERNALITAVEGQQTAIVAMGFSGAEEASLSAMAARPGVAAIAKDRHGDAGGLMRLLLQAVLRSITASVETNALMVQLPDGMRVVR